MDEDKLGKFRKEARYLSLKFLLIEKGKVAWNSIKTLETEKR